MIACGIGLKDWAKYYGCQLLTYCLACFELQLALEMLKPL